MKQILFCTECQEEREISCPSYVVQGDGEFVIQAPCPICNTKMIKSTDDIKGRINTLSINNLTNNNMQFKDFKEAETKYDMPVGGGFMKLLPGDNKIRIVSSFEDHGSHWSAKHERSFICVGAKDKCPFCAAEERPSVKYMGWVIDRKDGEVKLMTIGHSIFKQIGALAINKDYAFDNLPKYDITIGRTGEKKKTRYSVIADRKDTPLTKTEQALVAKTMKNTPEDIVSEMKVKMIAAIVNANEDEKIDIDTLLC